MHYAKVITQITIDGYSLSVDELEKYQHNLTLPYLEGIEYPPEPIINTQKEEEKGEEDDFDVFIEAPNTEKPHAPELIPTIEDRSKLIDEAFGNMMPVVEQNPQPAPQVASNVIDQAAIKTPEPVSQPLMNPEWANTGELSSNTKGEFNFGFNEPFNAASTVPAPQNIETVNPTMVNEPTFAEPYKKMAEEISDFKNNEQPVNPPLEGQNNPDDFDDEFGDFQESNPIPVVEKKVEDAPIIYRLNSEDIAAGESVKKQEEEIVEHIAMDEPGDDQDYIESEAKQVHEFEATNKESISEPVENKDEKPDWGNFLDMDFTNNQPATEAKVVEEDNKEMDEENLLENFLSAITEKMVETSKTTPTKEEVKKEIIPEVKPVQVPSRNLFYLSDKSKPIIGEDEKELNTNKDKLKEIEEWLWYNEEIDAYKKLHAHLEYLEDMNEYNEKKKEATEKEEFEKAIEYKDKANKAKEKLLPDITIKSFLRSFDTNETMGELIDKVISLSDIPLVY